MRSTDLVLADIKLLIKTKGYIYAFCLILFEDFHVNLENLHETNFKEKISVKEATLLLGFLVQNDIDFSIPESPQYLIELKDRTYSLMNELHSSFHLPQLKKWGKRFSQMQEGIPIENSYQEQFDFFVEDGGMIEPMFYAGDGVYNFQYLEFLERKYKYDKEWLLSNKNFEIESTTSIVNEIRNILHVKSKKVNLIGLRELTPKIKEDSKKKLKKRFKEEDFKKFLISAEFYQYKNLFSTLPEEGKDFFDEEMRNSNWKSFYENLIDLFIIQKSQFKIDEKTESFFDNFSFSPGSNINKNYAGTGYFNILNSKPLIKLDNDRYFVPINYLVAEVAYESPFYWMCEDKNYQDQLAKHRGQVGEEIAHDYLSQIFGNSNTFKSVTVSSKKGYRDTDIDVLCILGSKVLCVQVKSKKLTLLAKRGDTDQLVKDFKGTVQDAYDQGLVSRKKILDKSAKFYDEYGKEIKLPIGINDVYIMGVTTENYPSLTHQSYIMLEKKQEDPFPIFLSVFDLELLAHYLNDPYDFLYYIRQRISLMDYYRADEEIVYLGYHLKNKLWKLDEYSIGTIDSDYGAIIDRNYYPLKTGYAHMVSDTNDPIKNAWKDEHFDKLSSEIKRFSGAEITDIIFHILDWSGESRENLVNYIIRTKQQTLEDRELHSFSTATPPDFGVSYISNDTDSIKELQNLVLNYSKARKYKGKCNAWLGIGSLANSPNMIDCIAYNDDVWEYDEELEELSKGLLSNAKRKIIPLNGKKKIGRNDPCVCGSGDKYKKCCGK